MIYISWFIEKSEEILPIFGTKRIILHQILKATGKMLFKLLTVVTYVFWFEISEFAVKFSQKLVFDPLKAQNSSKNTGFFAVILEKGSNTYDGNECHPYN